MEATVDQSATGVALETDNDTGQYLTFMLDGEEYGVDILRVQEIKGWDTVTALPGMPDYIRGVINLRGTVIPIIDLRLRFGLEEMEYGVTTVVIVLRVETEEKERIMGVVVDAVSDVYNVDEADVKPSPAVNGGSGTLEVVKGIATVDNHMLILLAVDQLLEFADAGGLGME